MKKLIPALLFLLVCAVGLSPMAHADPSPAPGHLLWNNLDGSASVWNLSDPNPGATCKVYGPYPGWTARVITEEPNGTAHLLWTHTSGMVSLWNLSDPNPGATCKVYGPYSGWAAVSMSSSAQSNSTQGGSGLTGPAGGDLFGLYPNPTVAPNAIDHTKLASDSASLSQVSAGQLTTTDSSHVNVQTNLTIQGDLGLGSGLIAATNDINIYRNTTIHGTLGTDGNVSVGGSDFSLHGRGGGVGNNGRAGRALVDNGSDGLWINYANDFGRLVINSDAVVTGNLTGNATITANSLQITGGSDLAEPYKIAASQDVKPLPGLVVSIDPDQTGQMRVSTHAYDNTVGGIISGAGGVRPGVVLRQAGTVADGTLPIASVGRVWCWCDADAGGAITPGDLLTTSDTPGHAMRVRDHDKARGAILGKAMSPLKTGKGIVLVLVTLE